MFRHTSQSFELAGRCILFEESTKSLIAESVDVAGTKVKILNTRGNSSPPFEEPRFWFHGPGDIGPTEWKTPCKGPGVGIVNSGNSCFVNAALQALCYCPPVAQDSLRRSHRRRCERKAANIECTCCIFERFVERIFDNKGRNVSHKSRLVLPSSLRNLLGRTSHELFAQHDTHEALTQLLEKLRRCDLPIACERSFECHAIPDPELSTTYWNQLLLGFLEERRTCLVCKHISFTFQPFWDLILSIANQATLEGAMDKYFESERLQNGNEVWCDFCDKKQPKLVERKILRPPNILTVVFQRVYQGKNGVKKLKKDICIPLELNISPYRGCSSDTTSSPCSNSSTPVKGNGVKSKSSSVNEEKRISQIDRGRRESQPTLQMSFSHRRTSEHIYRSASDDKVSQRLSLSSLSSSFSSSSSSPPSRLCSEQMLTTGDSMKSLASGSDNYLFCSAIAHTGSAMFGHYFTYCRASDNRVYVIDDENVTLARGVRDSHICLPYSSAYVCMFVRRDPVDRPKESEVVLYSSLCATEAASRPASAEMQQPSNKTAPTLGITEALKLASMKGYSSESKPITARVVVRDRPCDPNKMRNLHDSSSTSSKLKDVQFNGTAKPPLDDSLTAHLDNNTITNNSANSNGLPQKQLILLPPDATTSRSVEGSRGLRTERASSRNTGGSEDRQQRRNSNVNNDDSGPTAATATDNDGDLAYGDLQAKLLSPADDSSPRPSCRDSNNKQSHDLQETIADDRDYLSSTPPETPQYRQTVQSDISPGKLNCTFRRNRCRLDPEKLNREAKSLMSQFGCVKVGDWEHEEVSAGIDATPLIAQRRSQEFTDAQRSLKHTPACRSEHDKEYDRGKVKKVKLVPSKSCSFSSLRRQSGGGVVAQEASSATGSNAISATRTFHKDFSAEGDANFSVTSGHLGNHDSTPRVPPKCLSSSAIFDKAFLWRVNNKLFFRGRKKRQIKLFANQQNQKFQDQQQQQQTVPHRDAERHIFRSTTA